MAVTEKGNRGSQDKPLEVKTSISTFESSKLRKVQHKAVAGATPEQLIEKHTIGELEEDEQESQESEE